MVEDAMVEDAMVEVAMVEVAMEEKKVEKKVDMYYKFRGNYDIYILYLLLLRKFLQLMDYTCLYRIHKRLAYQNIYLGYMTIDFLQHHYKFYLFVIVFLVQIL